MFIIDDIINAISGANAAGQQADAAKQAMGLQRDVWNQSRADQAPWMQAGMTALGDMARLGRDPSSIANNPAYQFRMSEGQKALERSAAARGGLRGGGFAKGMARYSQGLASDEYGNQWNRLAQVAGMGQGSAQNLGSLGAHYGDSMSSLYGAKGNADAAGTMAIGNGIAGGVRSIGNIATLGLGGGLSALGIPGLGGGGGGGGGYLGGMAGPGRLDSLSGPGAYIPRQGGR